MYRLIIDENNMITLPVELVRTMGIEPGSILLCSFTDHVLTLRVEREEAEPTSVYVEMIVTELFWLPAEISIFKDRVRVRCKEPYIEVWSEDKEQGLQEFISQVNERHR